MSDVLALKPGVRWEVTFRCHSRMLSDGSMFTIHYWQP